MRLRAKLGILASGLMFGIIGAGKSGLAADPPRPNVVFIVADDLGYADVGFNGCPDVPTPHIDALARGGMRCANAYVSGPNCSPTRAGLMTGRYQQRFGHEFNPPGEGAGRGLPLSETTIADRLKAAGYATGLVGKWHLGAAPEYHPLHRGFDEFFGFLSGAHPYFPGPEARINRGTRIVEEKEYLTDAIAREAASFVDRHKAQPFLLMVLFNAVHTPMQAADGRLKRFASIPEEARRTYAAMLAAMDEGIGRVIDALRANRLEENTLIVFLSDNGGPTLPGTTINGARNQPLRGSKRTTLEGGVRVPFVIQWKGTLPPGVVYEPPVIQLDLLPTALAAAGVAAEPGWKLDGVDLLPFLRGKAEEAPHDSLYWRQGPQMAIRRGAWKLVRYDRTVDEAAAPSSARSTEVTPYRLYDLDLDRGEETDLAARHPGKAAELLRAWQAWNAQLVTPLWGPG
jgi:arylsulfatase A-like enzyme